MTGGGWECGTVTRGSDDLLTNTSTSVLWRGGGGGGGGDDVETIAHRAAATARR